MEKTHPIMFLCRIKQYCKTSNTEHQTSKYSDKRSVSPIKSKSPNKKKNFPNSFQIFTTTSENEIPKVVVSTENPIQQKHINSFFRTEKDLYNYQNTILKKSSIFNYDGVFDSKYKFFFKKSI